MDSKKFSRIGVLILAVILILQGVLLITNTRLYPVELSWDLFHYLSVVFWAIIVFEIGAIVGAKYIKE